ncbi:unnamed protein product [Closterium sp. NIES-54]
MFTTSKGVALVKVGPGGVGAGGMGVGGAGSWGAGARATYTGGAGSGGVGAKGTGTGGSGSEGVGAGGTGTGGVDSGVGAGLVGVGAAGAVGAGAAGAPAPPPPATAAAATDAASVTWSPFLSCEWPLGLGLPSSPPDRSPPPIALGLPPPESSSNFVSPRSQSPPPGVTHFWTTRCPPGARASSPLSDLCSVFFHRGPPRSLPQ